MTTFKNHPDHQITYVEDVTREFVVTVDDDGDLALAADPQPDILDIHDSSIWCSTCGRLDDDECTAHGISDYWEIV